MPEDAFIHGDYADETYVARTAPKYSLAKGLGHGRNGASKSAKLAKWDVADIRRWIRGAGFELTACEQLKTLRTGYPEVTTQTMRLVVQNKSWYDPTYDPTVRDAVPCVANPHWFLQYCPAWAIVLLFMMTTEVTCSPSRSTER